MMKTKQVAKHTGEILGRISLPASVLAQAARVASEMWNKAVQEEFCGDLVKVADVPKELPRLDEFMPIHQLRDLGLEPDTAELAQWVGTAGVDQHTDFHGPVLVVCLHNVGLKFKQGRTRHVTSAGDWFVFDDTRPHEVDGPEDAQGVWLGWSVPLRALAAPM